MEMTDTTKSDAGRTQTGGPQAMLRGLLVVLALALVVIIGVFGYQMIRTQGGDGPAQVAMLDPDAIYALPEFKDASKQLEDMSKKKQQELIDTIKAKKLAPAEQESLRLQMRQQLSEEQAKKLKPLNDRVTAAIATLARDRKLRVVLDKKIVLSGVPDITEDVKKLFEEKKELQVPKETGEEQSHVGYVNQEVIQELKLYKEAEARLFQYSQELEKAFQGKQKGLSDTDKEKLRTEMMRDFNEKKLELLNPVNEKVNEAIGTVAKEKGLSLVLNNTHVMWGGRNLTDDVIKKLVDRPAKG